MNAARRPSMPGPKVPSHDGDPATARENVWAARGPSFVKCSELSQFPGRVTADPPGRSPVGRILASCLVLALAPSMALAQQSPRSETSGQAAPEAATPEAATSVIGAPVSTGPCVQVEVGGERVGHLDCAAEALQAAARVAQQQARAPLDVRVPEAGSPDATVGVSSLSGARLRLGPALGTSVTRPPASLPSGRP